MDICMSSYVCMYVCMCVCCDVVKPCYSVSLLHITVIFVMIVHSTHVLYMFINTLYHQQLWLPCFVLSLLKNAPFNGSGVAVTHIWPFPLQILQSPWTSLYFPLTHLSEAHRPSGICVCVAISLGLSPARLTHTLADLRPHCFDSHVVSLHTHHVSFTLPSTAAHMGWLVYSAHQHRCRFVSPRPALPPVCTPSVMGYCILWHFSL